MSVLPKDYLERVYSGVLGKLIGVYLGRPFEGWTYQRIMAELGPIEYYVHDRLDVPLVVTDDDVAGTFTFVRALEDYGISPDLKAEDIGNAWLNYLVKERSILWWGGNGNSTEHTAWLNLKRGIPAPESGSIEVNGKTIAEQIGAQIFIDCWALVAPCQPELAAKLAEQAGRVSHDGESVHASMFWAAMEAEAFRTRDIDKVLDIGLSVIPADCLVAKVIADVRNWVKQNPDWHATRQLIENNYGYDKYPGNCHIIPNHAIMIMSILYAPDDYQKSQMIINTSGWDTDCNAGNVGCLIAIKEGLACFDQGPDFRGPLADRMLISSSDGGNSINDAVRIAYYLTSLGRQLAGLPALEQPKSAAQFHFSLPGSLQGFQPLYGLNSCPGQCVSNASGTLALHFSALGPGQEASATTPVFTPPEVKNMRTYDLMASPLLYPGQTLKAHIAASAGNVGRVKACLRLRIYDSADKLRILDHADGAVVLSPGDEEMLSWTIPDLDGQPIAEIGIVTTAEGRCADGMLLVDYMRWDGCPSMTLHRPEGANDADFWRMAWVNGVDFFSKNFPPSFRISQSEGEGMIIHGTRQWTDYTVKASLTIHLGNYGGLGLRVQGLRRYYGIRVTRAGKVQIVKICDGHEIVLADKDFPFDFEKEYPLEATVFGNRIQAKIADVSLTACDDSGSEYRGGGFALIIHEGALSTDAVAISPATM